MSFSCTAGIKRFALCDACYLGAGVNGLLKIHGGPSPRPFVISRHINFIWQTQSLLATALAGDRVLIVVPFPTLVGDRDVCAISCYAARSSRNVLEGRAGAKSKAEGKYTSRMVMKASQSFRSAWLSALAAAEASRTFSRHLDDAALAPCVTVARL